MAEVTVDEWVRHQLMIMDAVVQTSTKSLVDEAQTPVAKGGNMPVVTGFLTNSIAGSLDGIPSGESSKSNALQVDRIIAQMRAGDTVYLGWTAVYAPHMELKYGYARLAAQNWPQHVDAAVRIAEGIK